MPTDVYRQHIMHPWTQWVDLSAAEQGHVAMQQSSGVRGGGVRRRAAGFDSPTLSTPLGPSGCE